MYKGILLEPAKVKEGHERIFAGVMQVILREYISERYATQIIHMSFLSSASAGR